MKLNKNELNGKWFKADRETFDALVNAGYSEGTVDYLHITYSGYKVYLVGESNRFFSHYQKTAESYGKQAYHHNGEFYTIDGEWLVDEDGFTEVARIPITEEEEKRIINDENELTYGETQKPAFPALEDINVIKGPGWLRCALAFIEDDIITRYGIAKEAYENGVDVTWEPKDKHAKIKAQYAEAKKAMENGGPIVKIFGVNAIEYEENGIQKVSVVDECEEVKKPNWHKHSEYRLKFYEIDFRKVLETSYRDGEFVECEFSDNGGIWIKGYELLGILPNGRFVNNYPTQWEYCRLPKGTEIKPEWLKEIKDA